MTRRGVAAGLRHQTRNRHKVNGLLCPHGVRWQGVLMRGAILGVGGRLLRCLRAVLLAAAVVTSLIGAPAHAVEAVNVRPENSAIDLGDMVERHTGNGDRITVSTAPGSDGIVRRIEVRAREAGTNWGVFALANTGDQQIDRLIVVPHYQMAGSGLFWPDLGLSRVVDITPSSGDRPDRQDSATADIFRVTL